MLSVPQHLPARHSLGYLHAPILHSQSCSMSQGRVHSGQSTVSCKATATDVVSTDCVVIGSGMGGERGFLSVRHVPRCGLLVLAVVRT